MNTEMKHLDKRILRLLYASHPKSIMALLKEPETPEAISGSESTPPLLCQNIGTLSNTAYTTHSSSLKTNHAPWSFLTACGPKHYQRVCRMSQQQPLITAIIRQQAGRAETRPRGDLYLSTDFAVVPFSPEAEAGLIKPPPAPSSREPSQHLCWTGQLYKKLPLPSGRLLV